MPRRIACLLAAAVLLACASPGRSQDVRMSANLDGKRQVPPVETAGSATATVLFDKDTRTVTWDIYYTGLSGEPTAAHFHGPASSGAAAGVQVDLAPEGFSDPLRGSAQLTAEQADQLLAEDWYVNFHTAAHPDGEIRGQIFHQP